MKYVEESKVKIFLHIPETYNCFLIWQEMSVNLNKQQKSNGLEREVLLFLHAKILL